MKTLSRIFRGFIDVLPAVLFFSYYPLMAIGGDETMNFEFSLPMIWLLLFDLLVLVLMVMRKVPVLKDVVRGWKWLMFPVFATVSVLWSLNLVRGVLTLGILWLVIFAIYGMMRLKDLVDDEKFRRGFWRWFIGSAIVLCVWCFVQCVMDAVGVPREYSLLCPGCISQMFGFPHPNGMAIEPQFMGNLLLAPAIVMAWFFVKDKSNNTFRGRGSSRPSSRGSDPSYLGSSLRKPLKVLFAFVFAGTLFLTFSRGAIYAFVMAMVFMSVFVVVREKVGNERKALAKRVGLTWGVVVLAFLFTLNLQGILAEVGPTNDTYRSGVAKVLNHLSLGIIDVRGEVMESNDAAGEVENEAIFDGYVEESTNIRMGLTKNAIKVGFRDLRTALFGVGIGGAGQAMYDAGLTGSPKEIVQNEYASLFLEVGLVGVAFAVMSVAMIVKVFAGSVNNALLLTLLVAYAVSLLFFSGFANALQIYLMPAVLFAVMDTKKKNSGKNQARGFLKKLVS